MASIINADTSNGLKLTSDTSGQLELQSAGSTKVTMDTSGKFGIGGTPSEPLSVFRTGSQTEGVNIRNTSSGNGSRLTFETTRSDDGSVQEMAAVQVYAVSGYDNAANSDAVLTFETQNSGTTAERMRITQEGRINFTVTGNGATSSNQGVSIGGGSNSESFIEIVRGSGTSEYTHMYFGNGNGTGGTIRTSGTSTSYNTSSDYRLKENVEPMTGSIDRLKKLKPSRFNFINDPDTAVDGFLAHEAQEIVPEAVVGTKNAMCTEEYEVTPAVLDDKDIVVTEAVMGTREVPDYQGIDQSKLVPLLTKAIQEQQELINNLTARIEQLEN